MRYRAEACFIDTEDVAADLGHWESRWDAQAACMAHALEVLTWEQARPGIWQASTNVYWYRVRVAAVDLS
jgi:hypothetical protein